MKIVVHETRDNVQPIVKVDCQFSDFEARGARALDKVSARRQ